jgi:VanZ family protein
MAVIRALYRHAVRWRWFYAALASVFIFTQSSFPLRTTARIPHLDKMIHFVIYFVLGMAYLNATTRGGTRTTARVCWAAFLLAVLYGASDEWHQSYVPGRTADWDDWIADAVGAGAALGVTWKLRTRSARWDQGPA